MYDNCKPTPGYPKNHRDGTNLTFATSMTGAPTRAQGRTRLRSAPVPAGGKLLQTGTGGSSGVQEQGPVETSTLHDNICIVLLSLCTFGFSRQTRELRKDRCSSARLHAHTWNLLSVFPFCSQQTSFSLICSEGREHGVTQPSVLGREHGQGLSPLHQRCQGNRHWLFQPFSQVTGSWQRRALRRSMGSANADSPPELRGLCPFASETSISLTTSTFDQQDVHHYLPSPSGYLPSACNEQRQSFCLQRRLRSRIFNISLQNCNSSSSSDYKRVFSFRRRLLKYSLYANVKLE